MNPVAAPIFGLGHTGDSVYDAFYLYTDSRSSRTIKGAAGYLCGIAAADICWKENLPQRGVVINQPCLVPAQR